MLMTWHRILLEITAIITEVNTGNGIYMYTIGSKMYVSGQLLHQDV